jgi:hypothetical protein
LAKEYAAAGRHGPIGHGPPRHPENRWSKLSAEAGPRRPNPLYQRPEVYATVNELEVPIKGALWRKLLYGGTVQLALAACSIPAGAWLIYSMPERWYLGAIALIYPFTILTILSVVEAYKAVGDEP